MMLRTLPLLALLASLPLSASILHDWKFAGLPDGSPISAVPDTGSVGGLTWLDNEGNPGNYNSSGVVNGNYRVTRRLTGTTSFYADIADLTSDSAPVWAVIELGGWNLVSRTNQILRFDFTTSTTGTMVAAQVRLNRDAREDASLATVNIGGNALGEGGGVRDRKVTEGSSGGAGAKIGRVEKGVPGLVPEVAQEGAAKGEDVVGAGG